MIELYGPPCNEPDKDFDSYDGDCQEMEVSDVIETADVQTGCGTDFHVREIPRFNAIEVRQPIDLTDIPLENIEEAPQLLRHKLTNVVNYCTENSPSGSQLNVVLRGPSLASDVQTI